MGNSAGKPTQRYEDIALEKYGCDLSGTVLCPENETSITCLNEGVCALYLKDLEDTCEQKCRCKPDYIGKYCHIYNGFLNATVGLMVGILLAIILAVFVIILLWYCCSRKNKKETPDVTSDDMQYPRVPLSNRMEQPPKGSTKRYCADDNHPGLLETEDGKSAIQYPIQNVARSVNLPRNSTSRSYSTYDNVVMDLGDQSWNTQSAELHRTHHTEDDSQVTTHLLVNNDNGYGTETAFVTRDVSAVICMDPNSNTYGSHPN